MKYEGEKEKNLRRIYREMHQSWNVFTGNLLALSTQICVYNSWKIVDHCHLINIKENKNKRGRQREMGYMPCRPCVCVAYYTASGKIAAVCVCVLEKVK